MTASIVWKRVGADLFIRDPGNPPDDLRHPTDDEFDALIACWQRDHHRPGDKAASADIHNYVGSTNLRVWLEREALKLGTDNQRERYDHDALPQEELLALARAELFRVFPSDQRWKPLNYRDVHHKGGCHGRVDIASRMLYTANATDHVTATMDHDTWERYRHILRTCDLLRGTHPWLAHLWKMYPGGGALAVTSQVYEHIARCSGAPEGSSSRASGCGAEIRRLSVRVVIQWAGRKLTREYAI